MCQACHHVAEDFLALGASAFLNEKFILRSSRNYNRLFDEEFRGK